MNLVSYLLPDYLAPYLINNDSSGLNKHEIDEIDEFVKKEGNPYLLSMDEDSGFYKSNDLNNMGCNCSTFTADKYPNPITLNTVI